MEHHLRLAEACERAAEELHDARQFDEYTHAPFGGNAILEADATSLRALATALRGARVMRKNPSEDGRLGALYLTLTLGDA